MQFVGLDTLHHIATGWRAERVSTGEINDDAVAEVPMLTKLVKEGKLGRKSGEGFFKCTCMLANAQPAELKRTAQTTSELRLLRPGGGCGKKEAGEIMRSPRAKRRGCGK